MRDRAQVIIKELELKPHIEGGYFKETGKSNILIELEGKYRSLYSNILFLLTEDNPSNFHRLTSDEVWYFHEGNPLTIHMITQDGKHEEIELSLVNPQYCVKAGTIFGSSVKEGYALVSCMVSPAFEYEDFELFEREKLLKEYPNYGEIIVKLTR